MLRAYLVPGAVHQCHQRTRHRRSGGALSDEAAHDLRDRRRSARSRAGGTGRCLPCGRKSCLLQRGDPGRRGHCGSGCRRLSGESGAGVRESHECRILRFSHHYSVNSARRLVSTHLGRKGAGEVKGRGAGAVQGNCPGQALCWRLFHRFTPRCLLLSAGMTCRPAFTTLDASRREWLRRCAQPFPGRLCLRAVTRIETSAREPGGRPATDRAYPAGDPAAERQFFETYADRIHRIVYRFVGDPEAAQDCVQETFIRAFERLGTFRGEVGTGHLARCDRGLGRRSMH
jgi:hypothetical protein